jgi:phosphomevalonate kinase
MTTRAGPIVTAPGKLFLAGEYAVLDGGTAVVAAISRRAAGGFVPGGEAASALVAEAVAAARDWLRARGATLPAGSVEVDTAAFSAAGRKLGLGSSAAAAVAAVGAALEAAGVDAAAERAAVLALAERAHRAFQGGVGSGADVAAAAHGGLLAVARRDGALSVDRLPALPVQLVAFSTGEPSSTVDRVLAVAALRARLPERHGALMRALADQASILREAIQDGDAAMPIPTVRDAHATLEALGRAAEVPIVTPPLAAAAALATELGGAAKPSGAGGGDVGVAFFARPREAEAFRSRAPALGLDILDVSIDPAGVSRRAGGFQERDHVARQA